MKILIASGGSGGHIFPAVSLAKEFTNEEVVFVASRRGLDNTLLWDSPYKKFYLSANPMPYKFGIKSFVFIAKLIFDTISSFFILLRSRPSVVVGFGGYTSGAIVLLASLLRIKTVIHEQNLVPGRTNRFLDKMVDKICISFEGTKECFKNKNTFFTGNPLRKKSLKECRDVAYESLGLRRNKFTVLVMGGSQGARSLNKLVAKSIVSLKDNKNLQILHIAGPKNKETTETFYKEQKVNAKVFDFIRNINEAYSVADMAITRSGAAAIFELASFKKPMILVPYPNVKNNQRFNAEFFANKNAAVYIDEKTITEGKLATLIDSLIKDSNMRNIISENAGKLSIRDGAKRLKEVILND